MQIWGKDDIVFKDYGFVVNPKHLFIHELRLEFEHNINNKNTNIFIQDVVDIYSSHGAMIVGNTTVISIITASFASTTKST